MSRNMKNREDRGQGNTEGEKECRRARKSQIGYMAGVAGVMGASGLMVGTAPPRPNSKKGRWKGKGSSDLLSASVAQCVQQRATRAM